MSCRYLCGLVVRQGNRYEGEQAKQLFSEQGAPSDYRVRQHVHQLA